MRCVVILLLSVSATLLAAAPARASGGAHVVDDSEVEAAGHCHLELWGTRIGAHGGLINLGPGCTHHFAPDFEIGGFLQPSTGTGASAAGSAGPGAAAGSDGAGAFIGPALKYTLRHDSTGVGVAVDAGFTYDAGIGRMEAVSALVPVTVRLSPRLRVNLNAGVQYIRADGAVESFLGAQAELALGGGFTLMAEHFGRSRAFAGDQAGLRWTPRSDALDVDLVVGRRIDGASGTAVSLGVTLRR